MQFWDKQSFIDRAKVIHGLKYCYDYVNFINSKSNVILYCDIHGAFETSPYLHIYRKQGCRTCGYLKSSCALRKDYNSFIQESARIHENRYNYAEVVYKNNKSKINIICPIHGRFTSTVNSHLRGTGCKKCAIERRVCLSRSSTEHFIKKAKEIHADRYDYSLVSYGKDNTTKVKIICREHGIFFQSPNNHLSLQGCPTCKNESSTFYTSIFIEDNKNSLLKTNSEVYILQMKQDLYKIGVSKNKIRRFSDIKRESGFDIQEVFSFNENSYLILKMEKLLHNLLKPRRFIFENKFPGHTECFSLDEDEVTELICFIDFLGQQNEILYNN